MKMEITEINMISDFEAGMKCLQNPSSISRFLLGTSLLKWGALFFAIFATLSSIVKRIKLLLIRFHTVKPFSPQYEQLIDFSEDEDEDEDEDDDVSLASSDDDDREEEEEDNNSPKDEDFSVKGSRFCFKNQWKTGDLRRSVSGVWSEFTSGKNVVKLWDSLGLSLDFDEDLINYDYSSSSVVSMWDSDQNKNGTDFSGGVWSMAAPAVVLTAEGNGKGDGVVLGGYDTRMRRRVPVLFGEWRSPATEVDGVAVAGGGKVYVRNDVNGVVTVGDVRNMRVPLENVNGETWWDADAVIVDESS